MVHIDSEGNVVTKKQSFVEYILSFFSAIMAFFLSLIGYSRGTSSSYFHRDQLRRGDNRNNGGGAGSSGSGVFRRGDDGFRRPIGRLPQDSGMSAPRPPCAGGGCGG